MAVLINGNGNPAVYANQDADWFASIMGNTTAITGVGEQFAATQEDANTISVADGVIITKEGRRIQLDANESDIFDIPTGTQGTTSYYIIGYHLVTDETSAQSCDTFVQLMDNGTDTIDEDTFRGGADEVYVSLYRVTQTGLNITAIDLLLPTVSNLSQISTNLTANNNQYIATYQNGKYGFMVGNDFLQIGGGGMPIDFSTVLHTFTRSTQSAQSYTMTEDGYLIYSEVSTASIRSLKINNTLVCEVGSSGSTQSMSKSVQLPLTTGDVVTVTNSSGLLNGVIFAYKSNP